MWQRRSEQEIRAIGRHLRRARYSPIGSAVLALCLVVFVAVVPRMPPSGILAELPAIGVAFVVLFLLLYIWHATTGGYDWRRPFSRLPLAASRICPLCHSVEAYSDSSSCSCGGLLEDLRYWRWIDDDKSASQPRNT